VRRRYVSYKDPSSGRHTVWVGGLCRSRFTPYAASDDFHAALLIEINFSDAPVPM